MKVLILIGSFPPDHSGAGLRIQKTYEFLEKNHDLKWEVLTLSRGNNIPGRLSNVSYVDPGSFFSMIRFCLKVIFSNCDLLHIVGNSYLSRYGCFLANLLHKKYIVELSIDPVEDEKQSWKKILLEKAFFAASGFIALTPRIKEYFESRDGYKRIFLRPNPVTLDLRDAGPTEKSVDQYQKKHEFAHLLVGRFTKRKGHMEALEMLNQGSIHEIIFAGPVLGDEDRKYLEDLKEYINSHDMQERVTIIPEMVLNLTPLIDKVDSLWCLSEREGLPNVVLEALWQGRPVFVKSSLGLGHIVTDGENGFNLETPDLRVIEEAMKKGFDNDKISAKAKESFSIERHSAQTWEFLNDIVKA